MIKTKFLKSLYQNKPNEFPAVLTNTMISHYYNKNTTELEYLLGETYCDYTDLYEEDEQEKTHEKNILRKRMKNIRKMLRAIKYGEESYVTKNTNL